MLSLCYFYAIFMLFLCYYTSLNTLLIFIQSLSKHLKGHSGPMLVTFWEMEKVMKMTQNNNNVKELQPVGIYMEYINGKSDENGTK